MNAALNNSLRIFTGNATPELAHKICGHLSLSLGQALVSTFSDGEIRVEIADNVRGQDVFLIQSICPPTNHNLMELLIMIDAVKRASARRITAVIPYFGYARQDRKVAPRVPITAKLVADLISTAGAQRVLTMDLHVGQIQGFFNIPVDNLYASSVMMPYIKASFRNDLVMVSPDAGGVPRARAYAKRLEARLAFIDKRRDAPGKAKAMHIIGEVKDMEAVILDDII
ncbi:MAG TPA: ribose-phosphate pyrophosphokinase, partial [Desulfobaccales bacterium]|nr:ribose-phosphate pyrophosphokinase [Desulfobaccales bacterium]